MWVSFERSAGQRDMTIVKLRNMVMESGSSSNTASGISMIHKILTEHGTVDVYALSGSLLFCS